MLLSPLLKKIILIVLDNKVVIICEFEIQICVIMVESRTPAFVEANACMTDTFWTTSLAFVLKETAGE